MKIENVNVKLTNVESVEATVTDVQKKAMEMRQSLIELSSALALMGVEIEQPADGVAGCQKC